jgi:hypothetical protein
LRFPVSFVRSFDEKVVHPPAGPLALWLLRRSGEEAIRTQVTAKLQADTDANLFEISDFAILDKEERMEGLSGQGELPAPLQAGMEQLQVLHDEDLVYDRVGPFQQEMGLMELERKYGEFEAGQVLPQQAEVWMMKTEQGWRLAEPAH